MSALDDVAIVAVAGAIGLLTWEVAHVKIPAIPSPADLFKGVSGTVATVTNSNGAASWAAAGVPQNDYCSLIVAWRQSGDTKGIFGTGLFASNPNDYGAFTTWASIAGITVPAVPPVCWNEAGSPTGTIGGLGY